jgi:hypothetical protein
MIGEITSRIGHPEGLPLFFGGGELAGLYRNEET